MDFGAHTSAHTDSTAHIENLAIHALRNVPGGHAAVANTFQPKTTIDRPKPIPVMDHKVYGPYMFGR